MTDPSQFLTTLQKQAEPLISLKDLILQLCNYTGKKPNQIADGLESLLFGFRQNGKYTNAFCYCTIIDKNLSDREIYAPMENNFPDAFNTVKGYLSDVTFSNNLNSDGIENIFVRRSEIAQEIRKRGMPILDKALQIQVQTISQMRGDYISIYDLIEWAKEKYSTYSETANDLIRLLENDNLQLYRQYQGIKESIDKDNTRLLSALQFIANNDGYNEPFSDVDEIPF